MAVKTLCEKCSLVTKTHRTLLDRGFSYNITFMRQPEQLRRIRRVEGDAKPQFPGVEEPGEAAKKAALSEYEQAGQTMLDGYSRFFATFAQDVSLRFRLAEGFYIDLEHGEVNLDTRWFAEKDCTPEQIRWAVLHELSHFRDLAQDPKGMMKNFEYIQAQAQHTGATMLQKWEAKYGATDPAFIERLKKQRPNNPGKPEKGTMNAVERAAYNIHHTFYNIFDDIYVNNLVARRAASYEEQADGGKEVQRLYKEKLFSKTDYSTLPRHLQFIYALLRDEMVKDEQVVVSDEVQAKLDQRITFLGKTLTPKEIVDQLIKPKTGRDTKPAKRYFMLQRTLEPLFQQLLTQDLAEWDPEKPPEQQPQPGELSGEPQDSDPNPFAGDYDEFDKNSPDQIPQDDIDAWSDRHQDDKEKEAKAAATRKADDAKPAAEKTAEAQAALDAAWCTDNGVAPKILQQFRALEAHVAPYLDELSALWQRIIFGSSLEVHRGVEGHFKTGTELDITQVIAEWPRIEKADIDKVRVMKKIVQRETLVQKPELIRVRLVLDTSGSVDKAKQQALQQCAVLLLSSLHEFETQLNRTRVQTKSKLEVDTEARSFHTTTRVIKPLRGNRVSTDDQAAIVKTFAELQTTQGYTYDNKPLQEITSALSPEDRQRIADGKIMEIIIEVTDGGSSDRTKTKVAVDGLLGMQVIVRALQIGKVSEEETEDFNYVWNDGRTDQLGLPIGENIVNLLPTMVELLKHILQNVRL